MGLVKQALLVQIESVFFTLWLSVNVKFSRAALGDECEESGGRSLRGTKIERNETNEMTNGN